MAGAAAGDVGRVDGGARRLAGTRDSGRGTEHGGDGGARTPVGIPFVLRGCEAPGGWRGG